MKNNHNNTRNSKQQDDLIYFDSDVIDKVYDIFEGQYTKAQIKDVFDASVSYIHHAMTYTDVVSMYIRNIGFIHCNEKELLRRKRMLESYRSYCRGVFPRRLKDELSAIDAKLEKINSGQYDIAPVRGDVAASVYNMLKGLTWDKIQNFQNKIKF